jgi:mono/diheme cytochrome c family protein
MRVKLVCVAIATVVGLSLWQYGTAQDRMNRARARRGEPADLKEHGAYLVNSVGMCVDCHRKDLKGGPIPIQPKKEMKPWADEAPDISAQGLAGKWTEQEAVKFLTTGIDPDGKKARPPMPAFRLSETDARAVALYLHSRGKGAGREEK